MSSTMSHTALRIPRIMEYGTQSHAGSRVLTAVRGGHESETFATIGANAAALAQALSGLGVRPGDRVATLMWNNRRHFEAYLAVPSMGAVLHPLNFRLAGPTVAYIASHAEDSVVIVDSVLLPTLLPLLPGMRSVKHVIVNGTENPLPTVRSDWQNGPAFHLYEELLEGRPPNYHWHRGSEDDAAAMCYTSGTTSTPKGVVYSHRSIYLHAMAVCMPSNFDIAASDRILAVVPQFHVLAWGLPYAALLTGAELAMPDRYLAAEPLAEFIRDVRPNKAAGVPAVWQALLELAEKDPRVDLSSIEEIVVGGSACPPSLIRAYESKHGIRLVHAWGMTETSPLGAIARPPADADPGTAWHYRCTQGRFPAEVEARLIDAEGWELPHDGHSVGELEVRGPWVTASYHGEQHPESFHDGWLRTGDVAAITNNGYLVITDRLKDVIKSGGEWISSLELEGHLLSHPRVLDVAVIGVPDERWGERPLAAFVPRDGDTVVSPKELHTFLSDLVPKWQVPERWAVVDALPRTSVGKLDKVTLRRSYADGELEISVVG